MTNETQKKETGQVKMSGWEKIQAERSSVKSIDDFFGQEGILARRFSQTLEQMLEAELAAVMRKLLHLIFGILKSGRPFDPNFQPAS